MSNYFHEWELEPTMDRYFGEWIQTELCGKLSDNWELKDNKNNCILASIKIKNNRFYLTILTQESDSSYDTYYFSFGEAAKFAEEVFISEGYVKVLN